MNTVIIEYNKSLAVHEINNASVSFPYISKGNTTEK